MLELSLLLSNAEGALVRTLGLIERRGFRLGAMSTRPTPHGLSLTVSLAADGRPADILLRQIRRLSDVLEAALDVARPAFALPASAERSLVASITGCYAVLLFLGAAAVLILLGLHKARPA